MQLEADVCAVSTEYVPTGHGLQTSAEVCEAPASEKRPSPHAVQACASESIWARVFVLRRRKARRADARALDPVPSRAGQQATAAMEPPRLTESNMLLWSAVLSTHAGPQRGSWSYAYAYKTLMMGV